MKKIFLVCAALIISIICRANNPAPSPNDAQNLFQRAKQLYNSGNYLEAFDYYLLTMQAAKREGDDQTYLNSIGNLGTLFSYFDDYERAIHYYKMCYEEALKLHQPEIVAMSVINLAESYSHLGDATTAKYWFKLQNKHPLANKAQREYLFYHSQATIAYAENNFTLARALYKKALDTALKHQMGNLYTDNINNEIGECYMAESKIDSAIMAYHDNVVACEDHSSMYYLGETYKNLYQAYRASNDKGKMEEYRGKYIALTDSIFNQSQFNASKDKLYSWEDNEMQGKIDDITTKYSNAMTGIVVIVGFVLLVSVFTFIILKKDRQLKESYLTLYEKNKKIMASSDFNEDMKRLPALEQETTSEEAVEIPDDESVKTDYKNHTQNLLLNKIIEALDNPEYIFDPDFSLGKLTQIVQSNVRYVSSAINSHYGMPFKSLLNNLRIREACIRLSDDKEYAGLTIKAIAESVGYSSASNFIVAFKKITGMTPNIYQKMARMENAIEDN